MIDKSKRKATVEQHGPITVVHMTGGPDCLWLNMYLDSEAGQMTCDSDIGFYAYHWGGHIPNDESFLQFCCRWLSDDEWLLRKCIGERYVPIQFDRDGTIESLRKEYAEWIDGEDLDTFDFEDAIDEAYAYHDKDSWCAAFQIAADANGVELPEEWWSCICEEYTPWQKRFAEICREVVVPEIRKVIGYD